MEAPRVLLQGFIRILDHPLQHYLLVRDIVEISFKGARILQGIPTRIPADQRDAFREKLLHSLTHFYEQRFRVADVERDGITTWCVGTGEDLEPYFTTLVEGARSRPGELEDPQIVSP